MPEPAASNPRVCPRCMGDKEPDDMLCARCGEDVPDEDHTGNAEPDDSYGVDE